VPNPELSRRRLEQFAAYLPGSSTVVLKAVSLRTLAQVTACLLRYPTDLARRAAIEQG